MSDRRSGVAVGPGEEQRLVEGCTAQNAAACFWQGVLLGGAKPGGGLSIIHRCTALVALWCATTADAAATCVFRSLGG